MNGAFDSEGEIMRGTDHVLVGQDSGKSDMLEGYGRRTYCYPTVQTLSGSEGGGNAVRQDKIWKS